MNNEKATSKIVQELKTVIENEQNLFRTIRIDTEIGTFILSENHPALHGVHRLVRGEHSGRLVFEKILPE